MATLSRIELNYSGVGELLKSQEVIDYLSDMARSRAPDGCEVDAQAGSTRAVIRITAVTDQAIRDNLESNTLLEAIS